jgi:trigger factor
MNIKTEKVGSNQMGLIIEIESTDYSQKVENTIKDFRLKANVPGFRKGMVPLGMVKKMHGTAIKADEINKIITDELHKYLKDNNISFLGEPLLNEEKSISDLTIENANYSYYFEIGLEPEFDLKGAKFEKITDYEIEPSAEDIKKEVDYLTRQYGKLSEPETIADEDLVYGKVTRKSTPEAESFESTIFVQSIDSKKIKKDFIGKKSGDILSLDLKKAFTEDKAQIAKILKIKPEEVETADTLIDFEITTISRITPSEMNEEFYAKVFKDEEVASEADFMVKIKAQMSAQYSETSRQKFMNDAITSVVKGVEIDIPNEFMKKWLVQTNKELTLESVEAEYAKYQESIKWQMIENKLVKDNNIAITRQDIKDFIISFFKSNYFKNSTEPDIEERLDTLAESSMKTEKDVKNIYDQLFDKRIEEALRQILPIEKKSILAEKFIELINKK